MFKSGQIAGVVVRELRKHVDSRGWLTEIFRADEIDPAHMPVMTYVSVTGPGVARGPHAHADQTDFFAFLGPSQFELALWDNRPTSPTHGTKQVMIVGEGNAKAVIIPPGVVHAYRNIGSVPGMVVNCPNRLFGGHGRKEPVDEIRYESDPHSPFRLDEPR